MSDLAHGPLILLSAYHKQKLVHAMRVFFNQRIYNIQLGGIYMWFFQGPELIHHWPDFEDGSRTIKTDFTIWTFKKRCRKNKHIFAPKLLGCLVTG